MAASISRDLPRVLRGKDTPVGPGFPVLFLHFKRRSAAAGSQDGASSLLDQLGATPVPLADVYRNSSTGDLEVADMGVAVTVKEVNNKHGVFNVLPTGGNMVLKKTASSSRYGLWAYAKWTGVSYHINRASKWSLQGHDKCGKHCAVETRDHLLVAALTVAVSGAWSNLGATPAGCTWRGNSLTPHQLDVLAGFLGHCQPLVDPQDFLYNGYMQDALQMLMVLTGGGIITWWRDNDPSKPPPVYALLPLGAAQLLPSGMVGKGSQGPTSIGLAVQPAEKQAMQDRQNALNLAISSSSSSSSSSTNSRRLALALGMPPGTILSDSPDLVVDLQGAYAAFFAFWDGAYQTKEEYETKRSVAADQLKSWMLSYLQRLVVQVAH
jgi:hypothetical protein